MLQVDPTLAMHTHRYGTMSKSMQYNQPRVTVNAGMHCRAAVVWLCGEGSRLHGRPGVLGRPGVWRKRHGGAVGRMGGRCAARPGRQQRRRRRLRRRVRRARQRRRRRQKQKSRLHVCRGWLRGCRVRRRRWLRGLRRRMKAVRVQQLCGGGASHTADSAFAPARRCERRAVCRVGPRVTVTPHWELQQFQRG